MVACGDLTQVVVRVDADDRWVAVLDGVRVSASSEHAGPHDTVIALGPDEACLPLSVGVVRRNDDDVVRVEVRGRRGERDLVVHIVDAPVPDGETALLSVRFDERCLGVPVPCRVAETLEGLDVVEPGDEAEPCRAASDAPFGYALVPAGAADMGADPSAPGFDPDEGPKRTVTLTRPFWIATTEVTRAAWSEITDETAGDCPTCPKTDVSWADATFYLDDLSRREGLEPCYAGPATNRTFAGLDCEGYRLPTEAEWERAAATSAEIDAIAWCGDAAEPQPAASRAPSELGVFDMLGNAREWVHDGYQPDAYAVLPATDPIGTSSVGLAVTRGGSFASTSTTCRPTSRDPMPAQARRSDLGFRAVRTTPAR